MASSTITRHMDIVVKSIECYNMMVLDRNCNLHVPVAVIGEELTVDVGGTVNMEATTIDFTNSTIDFAGATINNFTGNVGGNISFTGNLNVQILTASDIYGGTYHGNVISSSIIGPLTGDVCGNIVTSSISEKVLGQGISVTGNLNVDTIVGDFYGNSFGVANGTFNGNSNGTFAGVGQGDFFGNFCGNVITDTLLPKTVGGDIEVFGNLVIQGPEFMLIGDACIPNLTVANIFSKDPNQPINIDANVIVDTINAQNVNVSGLLTTVTFGTSMIVSPMGTFSSLKVDTIAQNSVAGITFLNNVTFNANMVAQNIVANQLLANVVCGNDVLAERLLPKSPLTTIDVLADLDASGQVILADVLCGNIIQTDRMEYKNNPSGISVGGNLILDSGFFISADEVQTQHTFTNQISALTGPNIQVNDNVFVTGNIAATNSISAITVGGQYVVGLLEVTAGKLIVTSTSNQIELGTSGPQTITISAPSPTSSLIYTVPDVLTNASFVMTEGNQIINGSKTFTTPIAATSGGTGLSSYTFGDLIYASSATTIGTVPFGSSNQLLGINGAASAFEYKTLTAGTGISISYPSPGTIIIDAALAGVSSFSAGTTGFTPNIPSAGPIVLGGTLNIAHGGTGLTSTPTNGQLLIGNGAGYTLSTLTVAGTGLSIANGAGSITLTNTGVTDITAGTAISVSASSGSITVTNTGVTSAIGGTGISVSASNGAVTFTNTGVISFQTSLSGLTPSSASTGAVTLAGTLGTISGGTGTTVAPTAGQLLIGQTGGTFVPFTVTTGTGISTVTGSGTFQIDNTGVTSNTAGTGISLSSSTGAVTITNTGVTDITAGTAISVSASSGSVTITNTGVTSAVAGTGVSVSASNGAVTFTNTGVTSFSAGTTGLTPNAPSTGAVVLSGTLVVGNGGTGSSVALNNDRIMVSNAGAIVEATALTDGQLLIGSTGMAPVAANITGTTNQVIVTSGAGTITLSTPQDIHLSATPTFQSLTLSATTNQLVLGTTQTVTITAPTPAASLVQSIPDTLINASFVMTEGNQTINGVNTFTNTTNFDGDVNIGDNSADTLVVNAKLSAGGISGFTNTSFVGIVFDADQESIAAGIGGPISVITYFSDLSVGVTNDAYSLSNGTMNGQLKVIQLIDTLGGQAIITPTSLIGGTTITLPVSGSEVTLLWNGTGWRVIKRVTLMTGTPLPYIT